MTKNFIFAERQKRRRFVQKALTAFQKKKAKQKEELEVKRAEAREKKKAADAARKEEWRRVQNAKRLERAARKKHENSIEIGTFSEVEQVSVTPIGVKSESGESK